MTGFVDDLMELGIDLSREQQKQFTAYLTLLLQWNERMNLTAVRQPEAIQQRHFYDSLTCAPVMGDLNGRSLIDVGAGAGFPGLPLKILYPDLQLTLVESVVKKTDFLRAVVSGLNLSEVHILPERVEVLGQDWQYREQFDWAVARGVAEMRVLAEYLLPLCRLGGFMLAQKGENAEAETAVALKAVHTLGGGNPTFHQVQMPEIQTPHFLVVIEKKEKTPPKYPRRVGVPSKRPL